MNHTIALPTLILVAIAMLSASGPSRAAGPTTQPNLAPVSPPDEPLRPAEVLVIANAASKASMEVAHHYMAARGIPEGNLFTLDYPDFEKREPLDDNPAWLSQEEFRRIAVEPLQAFLEERRMREKILCFVTTYDTPYRVGGFFLTDSEREGLLAAAAENPAYQAMTAEQQAAWIDKREKALRQANASFDSELAWLYRPDVEIEGMSAFERRARYLRWNRNPYLGGDESFRAFRQRQLADPSGGLVYMVARLDGPTVAIAKGLVAKAIRAEREGVSGKGYFDAKGPGEQNRGRSIGDWWVRQAYLATQRAGIESILDTRGATFAEGECPEALVYWGWYRLFDYTDCFGAFPVGAIACHIASYEAANLGKIPLNNKRDRGGPWCVGFLRDGVTVTFGPVAEPYLAAFPHTEKLFPRVYGQWSMGEAYWAAVPHVSWMMVMLGDPLYRMPPMDEKPATRPADTSP